MSLRKVLAAGAKVHPPSWLCDNLCYETMMGSVAYGVSSDASDMDVYGICVPPKDMVFPHLAGEIFGFGTEIKRFDSWQEHHVAAFDKGWDFQILGIVKFFQLAMENNPNIIDSLFTPRRCVLSSTAIGEYIREHRADFLHKGAWHKFKGYAYSQLNKIRT
ncbi:MAG TPA: nucleotidyltransferase domain-containing protein, partial [Kofleriaceae bacterium]|nr:nucleotidyltransferase domain-containing protein [Kofleriaceae bacterium]